VKARSSSTRVGFGNYKNSIIAADSQRAGAS
jgi:hypothetical protein